jgi:hypothetical protein
MAEDAITDDLAEINPFKGIKLGGNDYSRSFEQCRESDRLSMHSAQRIGMSFVRLARRPPPSWG